MKKKVITIIIVMCSIITCFLIGFILVNMNTNNDSEQKNENVKENLNQESNDSIIDNEQKVVLDSKIGNEVLSKLLFPNLYSKIMYEELDKNGVSDDFKRMYTFSLMSTYEEFSSYLREGEDYIGSYITKDDLELVASKFFYDVSSLKHKAVFNDENTYDKNTESYVIVAKGYAGDGLEYIVEVPYEIYEYTDKLEVKLYRLYIKRSYDKEDEMSLPKDNVYYDKNMKNLAVSISDEKMFDEVNGQQDVLKYKINTGEIDNKKIDITTWTLKKQEGKYLIADYKVD